jgi:hypothetical protein
MHPHRRLASRSFATAAVLCILATFSPACTSSTLTCSGALAQWYASGCMVESAGSPLVVTDALSQCEQARADFAMSSEAAECPCAAEFDAELSCYGSASDAGCSNCTDAITAYESCLTKNAGCST